MGVFAVRYENTLTSAMDYARAGKIEEWVHTYLQSDGRNKELSDGLKLFDRYFLGPLKMPLSLFERCCGPEADMKWVVAAEGFWRRVKALQDAISENSDIPPLIVHYVEGRFELDDGNHRLEAYSRAGVEECYAVVWMTEKEEYAEFTEKYSEYIG